jgi:hypothetical protein
MRSTSTILILTVIANIVLVSVFVFGLYEIKALSADVVDLERTSIKEAQAVDRSRQIADTIAALRPLEITMQEYFVKEKNSIEFVEYVEKLSEVAAVESEISFGEDPNGLKLTIFFNGGFDECVHYVALLESMPYNTDLNSVYIEQVGNGWRGGMTLFMPGSGD